MEHRSKTLLQEILADWVEEPSICEPPRSSVHLAEVVDDRHPSLLGRVRVSWANETTWLPCMQGVVARVGDRVVVARPQGAREAVVVGVVDGYEERPRPVLAGPSLSMRADEALTVIGHRGRPLLQIRQGADGPVVRLLQSDVGIEVDGALSLRARAIHMRATHGEVDIEARDDVVVRGELIHLN